jgi:hypothetical protein
MSSVPTYGPFAAGPGRTLAQDDFLDFIGPMLQGNGVNSTDYSGSGLQVYADNSGLVVRVRPGSGMVRGAFYQTPSDVALNIGANTSSSTRIDRVVLSMNRSTQVVTPLVVAGTPGGSVPPLTQIVGGTWQIPLAQVQVPPNVAGISPGNVVDERQFLPLKVLVVSSATNSPTPMPPADGTAGRLVYDRAVGALLVTNGSKWYPISLNDDTGWQPVDTAGPLSRTDLAWTPAYAAVRKRNGWVEFIYDGTYQSSPVRYSSEGIVAHLGVGFRPSYKRSWDVPNSADGTSGRPAHVNIATDGTVTIGGASDGTETVVNVGYFADN